MISPRSHSRSRFLILIPGFFFCRACPFFAGNEFEDGVNDSCGKCYRCPNVELRPPQRCICGYTCRAFCPPSPCRGMGRDRRRVRAAALRRFPEKPSSTHITPQASPLQPCLLDTGTQRTLTDRAPNLLSSLFPEQLRAACLQPGSGSLQIN